MPIRMRTSGLALLLAPVMLAAQAPSAGPAGANDWPMFGFDPSRSNVSTAAAGIGAAQLGALRARSVTLDGIVDASPIYLHGVSVKGAVHDVFFVTTSYGITEAIAADSGTILWRHVPAGYDGWKGTAQVTTATPVADPGRAYIYAANPGGRVEKLSVADGRAVWSTAVTLLPSREKIASALNLHGGHVIVTTGGYIGDASPYQGHVALLDTADGRLTSVWNSLCSDRAGLLEPASCRESGSAIWGRGGAVVDSATGNLFVATGNGRWDGRTNWGDAVLELDAGATHLLGNYTPTSTHTLDATDQDIGSTSPALLQGMVAQGGKDGVIRLLDWSRLRGTAPHKGGEVQVVPSPSRDQLFTAPAVWRHGGETWLIAADNGGTMAWALTGGHLELKWRQVAPGTSPVVAGGLLYVYDPEGKLRVYQPETGQVLAVLPAESGHWNSPIVVDGRIALPVGSSNRHEGGGALVVFEVRGEK